jgi:hypothetical protein
MDKINMQIPHISQVQKLHIAYAPLACTIYGGGISTMDKKPDDKIFQRSFLEVVEKIRGKDKSKKGKFAKQAVGSYRRYQHLLPPDMRDERKNGEPYDPEAHVQNLTIDQAYRIAVALNFDFHDLITLAEVKAKENPELPRKKTTLLAPRKAYLSN